MLGVCTALQYALELRGVVEVPPVQVEVLLRILGIFMRPSQNVKRTDQPQTQCVHQRI